MLQIQFRCLLNVALLQVFFCGAENWTKRSDGLYENDVLEVVADPSIVTDDIVNACSSENQPPEGAPERDTMAFTTSVHRVLNSGDIVYDRPSGVFFCKWWLRNLIAYADISLKDTPDNEFAMFYISLPGGMEDVGAYADRVIIHEARSLRTTREMLANELTKFIEAFAHVGWWGNHIFSNSATTHRQSIHVERH